MHELIPHGIPWHPMASPMRPHDIEELGRGERQALAPTALADALEYGRLASASAFEGSSFAN